MITNLPESIFVNHLVVHKSVLITLHELGDSKSMEYLDLFYFSREEKQLLIDKTHELINDPIEESLWNKYKKFLK